MSLFYNKFWDALEKLERAMKKPFTYAFWVRYQTQYLYHELGKRIIPGWKVWKVPYERYGYIIVRSWTWPFFWLYNNTMIYHWDKHFGVNFIGMVVLARHTSPVLALFICIAGSILKEFKDNHWRMVVNKDTVGDLIADSIGIVLGWFYGV